MLGDDAERDCSSSPGHRLPHKGQGVFTNCIYKAQVMCNVHVNIVMCFMVKEFYVST